VLGRRSSGEWFASDQLRLINLLGVGFILLVCTLVSLVFVSAGFSHSAVWALSSLVWLILVLPFAVWSVRRTIQLRRGSQPPREPVRIWAYYAGISLGIVVATAGVQVVNAGFLTEFWPFFLGLVVLLILGVVQFARLLWFGLFQ
jgi:hypothetical protein